MSITEYSRLPGVPSVILYDKVGELEHAAIGSLEYQRVGCLQKWIQHGPVKSLRRARVRIKIMRKIGWRYGICTKDGGEIVGLPVE